MLGWMLIFAVMLLSVALATSAGGIGYAAGITTSVVFGSLLLLSVLTRALRARA